jgi:hypothetical protein
MDQDFTALPALFRNKVGKFFTCFLLIALFLISSCNRKKPEASIEVAGKVPIRFIDARNAGFSRNQDTLFYNGTYFSGHFFHLYPTLDTAFDIPFLNGLQEGLTRKWYPDKQIAEERLYVKGKKEGVHKAWWDNGKPKFVFEVTDDRYCGELEEWYSSGQLAKEFHYVNGQEEGSQRLWWGDGRLRANYVVKKGRKYGSIGVKLCLNKSDSIYKK